MDKLDLFGKIVFYFAITFIFQTLNNLRDYEKVFYRRITIRVFFLVSPK